MFICGCFFRRKSFFPPVVGNIFLEVFETTANLKPKTCLRYVDDAYIMWSLGKDTLLTFLDFSNNQHFDIKFTIQMEKSVSYCLLMYWPTHTDR